MAASRRGFLEMFQALNQDSRLSTGLRTGDLAGLRLFTDRVAPLIAAARMKDDFAVMAQLRATSPLLQRAAIARLAHTDDPLLPIRAAVEALLTLDTDGQETTFLAVLECVAKHRLFEIPDALRPFVANGAEENDVELAGDESAPGEEDAPEEVSCELGGRRAFLKHRTGSRSHSRNTSVIKGPSVHIRV